VKLVDAGLPLLQKWLTTKVIDIFGWPFDRLGRLDLLHIDVNKHTTGINSTGIRTGGGWTLVFASSVR
jgi:hypothetical protein